MSYEARKSYSLGKVFPQYVPKYGYSGDSAIIDSPSSLGINTPIDSVESGSPGSIRSKLADDQGVQKPGYSPLKPSGSPYKKTAGEMLPPRLNLSGNTGSYKSGRRQRPRSLYADLDSYINNTAPSLVLKPSNESLYSNKLSGLELEEDQPSLQELAQQESNLEFSPPHTHKKRSSWYSNKSQTFLTLSPPPTNGGFSKSGSRSDSDFNNDLSRSGSPMGRKGSSSSSTNPFNYNPVTLSNTNILQKPAQRRGHRYKHSSVSMNFFLEPKKQAQLSIPTSLPIPSVSEFLESCTRIQKLKLGWCFVHLFYSSVIFLTGFQYSLMSLTTLSHLVFFDSINNFLVIIVEIFKNFEVWNKSSIRLPFGLTRLEVLFGFALGVALFYVGFDLITHSLEEFAISLIDQDFNHENHHNHHNNDEHKKLSDSMFLVSIFLGIAITFISNKILNSNYVTFSEAKLNLDLTDSVSVKVGVLAQIKKHTIDPLVGLIKSTINYNPIIKNPIKLLTLIFFGYNLFYPWINKIAMDLKINEIQTFVMSTLILYFAFGMIKRLSLILVVSYPYTNITFRKHISELEEKIETLGSFKSSYKVKKLLISKVNYQLYMVLMKLTMKGASDDEEYVVRNDISREIKSVLQDGSSEFEITIDVDRI